MVSWISSRVGARAGVLLVLVGTGFFVRETVPFLTSWPNQGGGGNAFCETESDAGRLLRELGPARVFLEKGASDFPIVLETLAASPDFRVPVAALPTVTAEGLLAAPPAGPSFWLIAGRRFAEPLASAGWTVSRPVQAGKGRSLHFWRVRPPPDGAAGRETTTTEAAVAAPAGRGVPGATPRAWPGPGSPTR